MLRVIGALEGISFVLLIFVAMPLKYAWEMPTPVRALGMAHGVLFLAYLALVARAARVRGWDRLAIAHAVGAALVPFATLTLDGWLRDEERAAEARASAPDA